MPQEIIDKVPINPESAPAPVVQETMLRHQTAVIDTNNVLISKEAPEDNNGINGNTLALITLPSKSNSYGGVDKQVALVDFGNEYETNPKIPTVTMDGHNVGHILGYVKSRFGVKAFNYTPEGHLASYVPLVGKETVFGREAGHESYMLGIDWNHRDNESVSRSHFTIRVEDNGTISITDHSTNGTQVKYLGNQTNPN